MCILVFLDLGGLPTCWTWELFCFKTLKQLKKIKHRIQWLMLKKKIVTNLQTKYTQWVVTREKLWNVWLCVIQFQTYNANEVVFIKIGDKCGRHRYVRPPVPHLSVMKKRIESYSIMVQTIFDCNATPTPRATVIKVVTIIRNARWRIHLRSVRYEALVLTKKTFRYWIYIQNKKRTKRVSNKCTASKATCSTFLTDEPSLNSWERQ